MYFSLIPDLQYDLKPTKYPFNTSDYQRVKNFFRRFKVNEDLFDYAVFFTQYNITDEDRPDLLAERAYGSPFYDWVILLLNNIINPYEDWPQTEYNLKKQVSLMYDDPDAIKHYETLEKKDSKGAIVLKGGLIVDQKFNTSPFKYYDSGTKTVIQVSGSSISIPISYFQDEQKKNDEKRKIYLLKGAYFSAFVNEFREKNLYTDSSDYINKQLKKTGI